jgi:hypothetical protein
MAGSSLALSHTYTLTHSYAPTRRHAYHYSPNVVIDLAPAHAISALAACQNTAVSTARLLPVSQ